MVHFEVLQSKLVYRDQNNRWYLSAHIRLDTGKIYYVLTHTSNYRKQEIFMSQYAAEDIKEFLCHWRTILLRNEPPTFIESMNGTLILDLMLF